MDGGFLLLMIIEFYTDKDACTDKSVKLITLSSLLWQDTDIIANTIDKNAVKNFLFMLSNFKKY